MRIVHSLVVTPTHAGLYETARDLIVAEEKLGHMAVILEPAGSSKGMTDDSVAIAADEQRAGFLADADVIIDHSGCDKEMLDSGVPIIHVRHGRPLSTFLSSQNGLDIWSHLARMGQDDRYKAFVTFWSAHVEYWENLIGRPCEVIRAPVDLAKFTPHGPKHRFNGKGGKRNVVIADMWRDDACPFEAIHRFSELESDAKLHVYGVKEYSDALRALLATLGDRLGEVGWSRGMANIYRAADLVMTDATIATRVVREAIACGCEVEGWTCPRDQFDPSITAKQMLALVERVAGVPCG